MNNSQNSNQRSVEERDYADREEWERIHLRRKNAFGEAYKVPKQDESGNVPESKDGSDPRQPKNLVGLSLSGGGLRSALFNEGFLQALSHKGLLRYVDYLASVSGGGYIAGRLMTFCKREKSTESFHDDQVTTPE
ncbi:MAG: hypothetical protein AAF483_26330, partial [Planctomycetota bacterium]